MHLCRFERDAEPEQRRVKLGRGEASVGLGIEDAKRLLRVEALGADRVVDARHERRALELVVLARHREERGERRRFPVDRRAPARAATERDARARVANAVGVKIRQNRGRSFFAHGRRVD
eukprot:6199814-Pleurochrysis_carterae.AAC.1